MSWEIRQGDALERLREMPDESVQTIVTSPPYWGLRDYGDEGQLGLEPTPEDYVANLVEVFREIRRVLRSDGTAWLNLGDSYAGSWGNQGRKAERGEQRPINGPMLTPVHDGRYPDAGSNTGKTPPGLKPKDLCGMPWMVAFALRSDGWWLRSDIIWSKPNPMPESVTDRPTRAHEYLFLLTKSARYFYDADAIREDHAEGSAEHQRYYEPLENGQKLTAVADDRERVAYSRAGCHAAGRNRRSVWEIATAPYPDAHFATFPPKLVEPCILAGSPPKCCGECGAPWERVVEREPGFTARRQYEQGTRGRRMGAATDADYRGIGYLRQETRGWRPACGHGDADVGGGSEVASVTLEPAADVSAAGRSVILDPFCGSGTTGVVALRHDRSFIGIELSADYCELARNRIRQDAPLLNTPLEVAA